MKANIHALRLVFQGTRATGVMVESGGGAVCRGRRPDHPECRGDCVSPAAHALRRWPAAHLRRLGLPVVHDLPGVGQNFRDHALVPILFHIDEQFIDDAQGPRLQIGLRYTVPGSSIRNDMQITPSWFTDPRGYTYADTDPLGIRFAVILEKALSAGEIRLASADPHVQPALDYRLLSHPFDVERMRHAVRLAVQLAQHSAFKGLITARPRPLMLILPLMQPWTAGSWRMSPLRTIWPGRAKWVQPQTPWRWTSTVGCTVCRPARSRCLGHARCGAPIRTPRPS